MANKLYQYSYDFKDDSVSSHEEPVTCSKSKSITITCTNMKKLIPLLKKLVADFKANPAMKEKSLTTLKNNILQGITALAQIYKTTPDKLISLENAENELSTTTHPMDVQALTDQITNLKKDFNYDAYAATGKASVQKSVKALNDITISCLIDGYNGAVDTILIDRSLLGKNNIVLKINSFNNKLVNVNLESLCVVQSSNNMCIA